MSAEEVRALEEVLEQKDQQWEELFQQFENFKAQEELKSKEYQRLTVDYEQRLEAAVEDAARLRLENQQLKTKSEELQEENKKSQIARQQAVLEKDLQLEVVQKDLQGKKKALAELQGKLAQIEQELEARMAIERQRQEEIEQNQTLQQKRRYWTEILADPRRHARLLEELTDLDSRLSLTNKKLNSLRHRLRGTAGGTAPGSSSCNTTILGASVLLAGSSDVDPALGGAREVMCTNSGAQENGGRHTDARQHIGQEEGEAKPSSPTSRQKQEPQCPVTITPSDSLSQLQPDKRKTTRRTLLQSERIDVNNVSAGEIHTSSCRVAPTIASSVGVVSESAARRTKLEVREGGGHVFRGDEANAMSGGTSCSQERIQKDALVSISGCTTSTSASVPKRETTMGTTTNPAVFRTPGSGSAAAAPRRAAGDPSTAAKFAVQPIGTAARPVAAPVLKKFGASRMQQPGYLFRELESKQVEDVDIDFVKRRIAEL
ncbi:unnamed protein product [Amoebophrya sp. A120]|nr:unnamed protein product [Amoebophrya sp. A120]|eukprot:GSA120T00001885001.1